YRLEIALSHSETWIEPDAGMRIAWMGVINDRDVGNFQSKHTGDTGFCRTVGANWPQMELVKMPLKSH
ncbi:MAG: hypothetical protein Q7J98_04665, partial [Kiritimatiellia bacterium]|nr:hypothetical protein [Kiritimatiellia bacterium]